MDGDATDPRGQWASSIWRGRAEAHAVHAAVGLAVPGRGTWYPQATMLFETPKTPPLPKAKLLLTDAEADALAAIAG
jgi:hypothetical protein